MRYFLQIQTPYPKNMPCPFCILNRDRSRVFDERELVYVMFSNPQLMVYHTLVIPKRHVEMPWELTMDERRELWDVLIEYQDKITSKLSTGCDVRQHYRPFLSESSHKINHVHYHLLPRTFEDEYYRVSQVHENLLWKHVTPEALEALSRDLRPQ